MHLKRIVVALIVLPLLYLYVAKLSPLYFLLLLVLVSVIAQTEFYSMYKTDKLFSLAGIISGILILCTPYASVRSSVLQFPSIGIQMSVFILSFMIISLTRLLRKEGPFSSLRDIAPAVIGVFYIPNLLIAQWFLRLEGYEWILFLYICVYFSDSAAFYAGKSLGKRKLYTSVSPNKTVAGAVGSVAGGIVASLVAGTLLLANKNVLELSAIGGLIGAVTIAGDLVESMFKRDAGAKDSGALIPGHGGILDKIDSLLFAGPVLYWITLLK